MNKVREIVGYIIDFVENYIKLIKDFVDKFKPADDADAE